MSSIFPWIMSSFLFSSESLSWMVFWSSMIFLSSWSTSSSCLAFYSFSYYAAFSYSALFASSAAYLSLFFHSAIRSFLSFANCSFKASSLSILSCNNWLYFLLCSYTCAANSLACAFLSASIASLLFLNSSNCFLKSSHLYSNFFLISCTSIFMS